MKPNHLIYMGHILICWLHFQAGCIKNPTGNPDVLTGTDALWVSVCLTLTFHPWLPLKGFDPGEQPHHHHSCQSLHAPGQIAEALPVQKPAEGDAHQHAQEPAGATHPWKPYCQNQEGLLPGNGPGHRHGYGCHPQWVINDPVIIVGTNRELKA